MQNKDLIVTVQVSDEDGMLFETILNLQKEESSNSSVRLKHFLERAGYLLTLLLDKMNDD